VAGVLGRPGAAGERDELRRRETTPTHNRDHAHTNTQTDRKLGGTVETVTVSVCVFVFVCVCHPCCHPLGLILNAEEDLKCYLDSLYI